VASKNVVSAAVTPAHLDLLRADARRSGVTVSEVIREQLTGYFRALEREHERERHTAAA
jgi:hypothetical protein